MKRLVNGIPRDLATTALLLPIACALAACAASPKPAPGRATEEKGPMVMVVGNARIEIEKSALAFPKKSGKLNGWLGYALARWIWSDSKFRERFPDESKYRYSYEEELDARESAVKIWSELRTKEGYSDRYFGDLYEVERAGFFREYVWYCVPHSQWHEPIGLRKDAFSGWLLAHLPSHVVETWVTTFPAASGQRVVLGVEAHQRMRCQIPAAAEPPPNPALNPTGISKAMGDA